MTDALGHAHALFYTGQYERARQAARARLAEAPGDADAHLVAAQSSIELEDYAPALDHAHQAVAVRPDDPDALRILAIALTRNHRDRDARSTAETVLRLDRAWQSHLVAAAVELDAPDGRLDIAQRSAEEAVRLGPQEPSTHHILGLVLLRTGKRDRAEAELRSALTLDPQNADARSSLGSALIGGRRSGEALDAFAQLAAEGPSERAHGHNLIVALGNSLRFVYFAVVLPYFVIIRLVSNLATDGSSTVRVLLLGSVALSAITLVVLGGRFIRGIRTDWRTLLRVILTRDHLLVAWLVAIGAILIVETVAAAVPDEALRFAVGLITVPTITSVVIWVVRLRRISARGQALSL